MPRKKVPIIKRCANHAAWSILFKSCRRLGFYRTEIWLVQNMLLYALGYRFSVSVCLSASLSVCVSGWLSLLYIVAGIDIDLCRYTYWYRYQIHTHRRCIEKSSMIIWKTTLGSQVYLYLRNSFFLGCQSSLTTFYVMLAFMYLLWQTRCKKSTTLLLDHKANIFLLFHAIQPLIRFLNAYKPAF